ncbi:MAG: hypothetical protein Fur0037_07740 [Planctomycetota bacterium]
MIRRILCSILSALLLAGAATAQDGDDDFNRRQAQKLAQFAKRTFDKGFPRQAKVIWLQVLKLYDPDHEQAHRALGHVKVGDSWNPDPDFEYPTGDTGSGADGAALFKAYEQLKKELASAHRLQAKKWARAGRTDRANLHWKMVLRWNEDDKEAQDALNHREIGTMTGTLLEQTLYERSKAIEKAIEDQTRTDYVVERVSDLPCPVLDRAQVPYITVRSQHFTLHGDQEEEAHLLEALKWAERTLEVAKVAFPWKIEIERWPADWAFFVAKDTYKQILQANAGEIPDLAWRLENTSTCGIGRTVVGATGSERVLYDAAVRNVAQGCAGFSLDGFREGIGHTFVGMMFNNNRLFSVDLKKQQGTTASEEDREYTSPDFDIWKTLNLELAWKNTGGVAANELPFCTAATFTNEQRIKAWSFCDYVLRRDPTLLREMDALGQQMRRAKATRPLEFEAKFDETHDVKISELDKEWEDFWTGATGVLRAIQNNTPPLAAVSKGVEKWLSAFNEARKELGSNPVTWSSNLSTRCRDHAEYLKQNKDERGPEREHRQAIELGGTHLGSMFAEMALVETRARLSNAKKMFQAWLDIPGYRDALVHNYLLTIGLYTDGDILVLNATSGLGEPRSNPGYSSYPKKGQRGVPTQVAVDDLGPELRKLLEENGKGDLKVVGYPLTLHFGMSVQGNRKSYRCRLTARGKEIPTLILLDGGKIRRTSAPGMVTAYPLEPLPHGDITAVWTWERDDGQQSLTVPFET